MAKNNNDKQLPKGIIQRPDGRYMGRFTYAGERYTLYDDDNPKRLKKAMEDKRYELEHGLYGTGNRLSLDKWFDEYISTYKEPVLKESTIAHYRLYYRLYIKDILGKKYLKDIKPLHIQKLYNGMKERGMKTNTIKHVANILHSTLQQAMISNLIIKNPCISTVIPKTEKLKKRVLSLNEQKEFLEFVRNSSKWKRYYPLFVVGFGTGMRIGEILALNWTDIDLEKKSISVSKTLQYIQSETDGKCKFILQSPKTTKSNRNIPMLKSVENALKEHKRQQHRDIIMLGSVWQKNDNKEFCNLVFTTETGNPLDRCSINRVITSIVRDINQMKQFQRQAGVKSAVFEDFSPHCMRHTFATRCFEAGIPPKTVQAFLGHSTISTTLDIYTHVMDFGLLEEMEKLENVI